VPRRARPADRYAALVFLAQALRSLETAVPGLCNEGLFALHAPMVDAQRRPKWHAAIGKARNVAARRERDLLTGLGYRVRRAGMSAAETLEFQVGENSHFLSRAPIARR
jgi:hypothetical protein